MKGFCKDFQIQIRRTMFVEIGAQLYGRVITRAPCTAITSAKLLFFTSWSPPGRMTASPSPTETGCSAHSFCSCAGVMEMRRMPCSWDCCGRENSGAIHPGVCQRCLGDAVAGTLLSAPAAAPGWTRHRGFGALVLQVTPV